MSRFSARHRDRTHRSSPQRSLSAAVARHPKKSRSRRCRGEMSSCLRRAHPRIARNLGIEAFLGRGSGSNHTRRETSCANGSGNYGSRPNWILLPIHRSINTTTFRLAHRQLLVYPRGTSMVTRLTTKGQVGCSKLIIPQNFSLGRAGRPSVLILKFLFQLLCGWREQKRPTEARMLSDQRKGLGLALRAWIPG
jgi:hypothetical protein